MRKTKTSIKEDSSKTSSEEQSEGQSPSSGTSDGCENYPQRSGLTFGDEIKTNNLKRLRKNSDQSFDAEKEVENILGYKANHMSRANETAWLCSFQA